MGLPKINLASLQCPHCAGLTKLTGIARADDGTASERLSFECSECGSFEVLAIAEPDSEFPAAHLVARVDRELQDLWA